MNTTTQPQSNNIDSLSQNTFKSDNIKPTPQQNIGQASQPIITSTSTNDEELLRAFIGNNYEKITTRPFNFAGFFFTTFYMFYRKMFLYAILLFLVNLVVLNITNNFIITLVFNIAVGFLVNKIYLFYAKNKIDKIKFKNQQKDINELKNICSTKGGTSVGKIFLGLLAELGVALVVLFVMLIAGFGGIVGSLFNPDNWNITINGNKINNIDTDINVDTNSNTDTSADTNTDINIDTDSNTDTSADTNTDTNIDTDSNTDTSADTNTDINVDTNSNTDTSADTNTDTNIDTDSNADTSTDTNIDTKDYTLVEDVIVSGYTCFNSICSVSIEESGNYIDYVFKADNIDLFKILDDYTDYVKVNIYYTQKGSEKAVVDYKLYSKTNNEEFTNVKNEEELRSKIGLYSIGIHTESFTLIENGGPGFGVKGNTSFTYTDYTFIDSKNSKYEMKYIHTNGTIDLIEGNKYTITFEVIKDTFGYEFFIKNVK